MEAELKLKFGALDPFISTQIDRHGSVIYDKEKIQHFEKLRTAMMELFFNGYFSEEHLAAMHGMLEKNIMQHLMECNNA